MIALDTNVLVAAHRPDSDFHEPAKRALTELAGSRAAWCIPWPCVHEFIRVVTGNVFRVPTPIELACEMFRELQETSSLSLIAESPSHLSLLQRIAVAGKVQGAVIHDARIAAICIAHGVRELWTADRDFSRFPELKTRNPLIER